jgi:hypothetical protein
MDHAIAHRRDDRIRGAGAARPEGTDQSAHQIIPSTRAMSGDPRSSCVAFFGAYHGSTERLISVPAIPVARRA